MHRGDRQPQAQGTQQPGGSHSCADHDCLERDRVTFAQRFPRRLAQAVNLELCRGTWQDAPYFALEEKPCAELLGFALEQVCELSAVGHAVLRQVNRSLQRRVRAQARFDAAGSLGIDQLEGHAQRFHRPQGSACIVQVPRGTEQNEQSARLLVVQAEFA